LLINKDCTPAGAKAALRKRKDVNTLSVLARKTWSEIMATEVVINNAVEGKKLLNGRQITYVHGTIMPSYFGAPFVPTYQRGVLLGTRKKQAELMVAMTSSEGLPGNITLCLRADTMRVRGGDGGGGRDYVLQGPLAIFDGHQRLAAGCKVIEQGRLSELKPLEVTVYIDTDETFEKKIFRQFNKDQTPVGPQVHMRNHLTASPAATALWNMVSASVPRTADELLKAQEFVLFGHVQFDQTKTPGDLITLHMLLDLVTALHGCPQRKSITDIVDAISGLASVYGQKMLLKNTQNFFEVADECFPFDDQAYHTNLPFLRALALLFAEHEDFWNARNPLSLQVPADLKKRLSGIKPIVLQRELNGSRQPAYHLKRTFVHQIDGRRRDPSKKLQPRRDI
jgi:hypothetical protein